jgi:putative DNA methylase
MKKLHIPVVFQASATELPYPDNYFDAVFTDPPYYNNVPYADLSDFFYVWLKRSIGDLYPDLFSTPLTPKSEEICEMKSWDPQRYYYKDREFFESMLKKSFQEIYRVLKPDGIACIVFAHKSTEAWESVINALLSSGLYISASWPIHTEMEARLRAKGSAALASSIYMVCRKRTENKTAYFNEIKSQIEERIKEKLDQFWNEGISGADFFISAIGPALEIFGKYESVEKLSGEKVTAKELLDLVRKTVSEYALTKILKNPQLGDIDKETRFYILWRWIYNRAKVHFDDARKLAQAVGIELTEKWGKGFIEKENENIIVLTPIERDKNFLEKKKFENMIDVLHACLIYWHQNNKKAITEILEETGYLNNNTFWQVAQALSDILPEEKDDEDNNKKGKKDKKDKDKEIKEKKLLQGFLYGKESYKKAKTKSDKYQNRLFEEE